MADEDEVRIRGEFENAISVPAEAAAASMDELGDEALEAAVKMEAADKAADDLGDELNDLSTDALKAAAGMRLVSREVKTNAEGVSVTTSKWVADTKARDANTRSVRRQAGAYNSMTRIFGRLTRAIGGTVMMLGKFLMIGTVIELVNLLSVAIRGLSAATLGLANSMGPLVGILGGIPVIMNSIIGGFAFMKIVTGSLGNAMKVMNDPNATQEQIDEVMKNTHEHALAFLRDLNQIKPLWTAVVKAGQGTFFSGLGPEMKALSTVYLPIMVKWAERFGIMLNAVVVTFGRWLRSPEGIQLMSTVLNDSQEIFTAMLIAFLKFSRAWLMLSVYAAPMVKQILTDVNRLGDFLIRTLAENGPALQAFFLNSWEAWKRWGMVIGMLLTGLYNIIKLGKPMAEALGADMAFLAETFLAWTESAEGQEAITKFYKEGIPVFRALIGLAWALVKAFWSLGSNESFLKLINELQNVLLPALVRIFQASEGKFLPAIINIIDAFAMLADAGFIDAAAAMLTTFSEMFKKFAEWFAGLSPETRKTLATIIITLLTFGKLLGPVFSIIGKVFRWLWPLILRFGKFIGPLLGKLGPLLKRLLPFFAKFGPQILKIAGPVGIIIGVIISLIQFFKWLWDTQPGFRKWVTDLVNMIQTNFGKLRDQFNQFKTDLETKVNEIAVMMGFANWQEAMQGFMDWIGANLGPFLQGLVSGQWDNLFAVFGALAGAIIGVVEAFIWALNAGVDFVNWSVNFAKEIKGIWDALPGALTAGFQYAFDMILFGFQLMPYGLAVAVNAMGKFLSPIIAQLLVVANLARDLINLPPLKWDAPTANVPVPSMPKFGDYMKGAMGSGGGGGKGGSGGKAMPALFRGGTAEAGQQTLVGERGVELGLSRGMWSLLGANGPEVITPSHDMGVIPNSALHGGSTGNAPDWAANALQTALGAQNGQNHADPLSSAYSAPSGDFNVSIGQLTISDGTSKEEFFRWMDEWWNEKKKKQQRLGYDTSGKKVR